jgi:hypothetical protein
MFQKYILKDFKGDIQAVTMIFLSRILDLDELGQCSEQEFREDNVRIRADLIAAFSLARSQLNVMSIVPSISATITSMETYELFHQGWAQNRTALHSAVLSCPALAEYRWMFLPEEGCIELIDAVNGLRELIEVVGDSENLFYMYKPQCHQTLTNANEHMEGDGHDMGGIELSYTRCLASLESYAAFRDGAAASHASIVAAVRNQRVFAPFLGDLQPVMLVV